jgi:hypothetical protein
MSMARVFEAQPKGILLVAYRRRYLKLKKMNGCVRVRGLRW